MNNVPDWLRERRESHLPRRWGEWSRGDEEPDGSNPLLRDVAFNRHSMNDGEHVSPSDNGMLQVGVDNVQVRLLQGIDEEQFKKTLTAAVRATVGLDLSQPLPGTWENCLNMYVWDQSQGDRLTAKDKNLSSDYWAGFTCDKHEEHRITVHPEGLDIYLQGQVPMNDWEEMLKGGLQTALETQTIVFAVSGVSRTCTHQLVRSRRASFHQQSQRAGFMGDRPEVRIPESIWEAGGDVAAKWWTAVMKAWEAYQAACEADVSYQDARFILPEGTTNFILLEYPVREFLNLYAYRGCSMFQWEIVHVMRECRRVLVEAHPWIEPYVKISCEKTGPAKVEDYSSGSLQLRQVEHHCTFQGWEDVEGQCDFPWAKHDARTFKPQYHRISRKGAE